jgi:hypothetical protein
LCELANEAFNPAMAYHHYLSLAKKKLLDDLTQSHAKSYLYALRALLCAQWIIDTSTIPSVDALPLIERYMAEPELNQTINQLIADKATDAEKDAKPLAKILLDFANSRYEALRLKEPAPHRLTDTEKYDRVIREMLGL